MSDEVINFSQEPAVPEFLIKEVLSKLAYLDERVKSATIAGDGSSISVTLGRAGNDISRETLGARVRALVIAMVDGAFEPDIKIIEERTGQGTATADPMHDLVARHEIIEEGEGYYAIGPLLTRLIEYVDRRIKQVANTMDASPYRFPSLIAPAYLERVKYFKNFPHSLGFCTHLRESLPEIERFSCDAVVEDNKIKIDGEVYAAPSAMLSPTVCHHLYNALQSTTIRGRGIAATANGHCFRYESRNMRTLERVWNFTMRELIFVGDEDYVSEQLSRARTLLYPIFDELDLTYKVMTANDPFFIGTFRDQAAYQAAFDLKFEVRADLPYKQDTLAIASYNRHGDFFGRTLDIKMESGASANTGCFGLGFERMALAVVAQHGSNFEDWPEPLRRSLGEELP